MVIMAITGPIKIDCDEAFPHGLGIGGPVTPLGELRRQHDRLDRPRQ